GWCARRHNCEALTAPAVALTQARDDWPFHLTPAHTSRIGSDPVAMGLALYVSRYFISKWSEGSEFYAKVLAERGIIPLGFKARTVKGRTSITNVPEALRALEQAGVPR